jgi:hypothetical protein
LTETLAENKIFNLWWFSFKFKNLMKT